MTQEEQKDLLLRYLEGACNDEEKILVESWYKDITANAADPDHVNFEAIERAIWQKLEIPKRHVYKRWIAAAAILAVVGTSIIFYMTGEQRQPIEVVAEKDIPPGGNKAVLTLANGQQVILDTVRSGAIAQQGGATVTKNANGQLVYNLLSPSRRDAASREGNVLVAYNTITTPRGGQFEVILPDGSKVTLNAASSLKYPTKFTQTERTVALTGEAYFDVKSNPQKPFVVISSEQQVKVLGTHFNVSCYASEPIKTTLAEGKVEISRKNSTQKTTLKPGDQSIVTSQGIEVRQVNPKNIIAWKDGMFVFDHTSMKDVMKQFSHWYNVDVDYSTVPDKAFDGEVPRNISLLKVLETINAYSEYQFTLEGRRIVRK